MGHSGSILLSSAPVSFSYLLILYIHCHLQQWRCIAQLKCWLHRLPSHDMTHESLNSCRRANECSRYEECVCGVGSTLLYLHSEPGDPLAAGLSESAVGICTAGHTSYTTVHVSLNIHSQLFSYLLILPGGTNSSL